MISLSSMAVWYSTLLVIFTIEWIYSQGNPAIPLILFV